MRPRSGSLGRERLRIAALIALVAIAGWTPARADEATQVEIKTTMGDSINSVWNDMPQSGDSHNVILVDDTTTDCATAALRIAKDGILGEGVEAGALESASMTLELASAFVGGAGWRRAGNAIGWAEAVISGWPDPDAIAEELALNAGAQGAAGAIDGDLVSSFAQPVFEALASSIIQEVSNSVYSSSCDHFCSCSPIQIDFWLFEADLESSPESVEALYEEGEEEEAPFFLYGTVTGDCECKYGRPQLLRDWTVYIAIPLELSATIEEPLVWGDPYLAVTIDTAGAGVYWVDANCDCSTSGAAYPPFEEEDGVLIAWTPIDPGSSPFDPEVIGQLPGPPPVELTPVPPGPPPSIPPLAPTPPPLTPPPAQPACGNGIVDRAEEECDGSDLAGKSCLDVGFPLGTLACTEECTLDVSGCHGGPACGNGVLEPAEECDGFLFGDHSCLSLGFTGGSLLCFPDCTIDTSTCTTPPPPSQPPQLLLSPGRLRKNHKRGDSDCPDPFQALRAQTDGPEALEFRLVDSLPAWLAVDRPQGTTPADVVFRFTCQVPPGDLDLHHDAVFQGIDPATGADVGDPVILPIDVSVRNP